MRSLILFAGLICAIMGATVPPPAPAAPDPPPPVVVEAVKPLAEPALSGGVKPEPAPEVANLDELIVDPAPAAPEVDLGCFTYPVRFRGYDSRDGKARFRLGSAVSIGGGKFLATAHDVEGLQAGYVVEFQIGEQWHKATSVRVDRKSDILQAEIERTDVAGVPVRRQEFGEHVTVYGLTTCKPMKGRAYADVVGLEPDEPGVESGDSGGGIFAEDGSLVGLVSGHGVDRRSLVISRLGEPTPEPPVASKEPTLAAPKPNGFVCRNGQCWRTN